MIVSWVRFRPDLAALRTEPVIKQRRCGLGKLWTPVRRYSGMPFVLLYLVVEIVALVALGSVIGLGWTLLVLLASALVGMWLARREGVRAAQAITEAVTQRRVPHAELTDGMLVAGAGVLLFVPGLVTDVVGFLLLLPPVRRMVRNRLVRAAEERVPELRTARIRAGATIVDGDVARPRPDVPVIEGAVVPRA